MSAQHPIREEDLELLALGAVAGEECESMRVHLAACADCSRRFAEARGRVALFAFAAPPQNPPASARRRLLQKIRAEELASETSAPATPARSQYAPFHPQARWWKTIWLPATVALAILTLLLWTSDRRIDNQLRQLQQQVRVYQAQAHRMQELAAMLAAQDTKTVALAPTPRVPNAAWGRVKYNSRMGIICYTGDLPAPPPDKEYQMWIVPMAGSPISGGAFMPASFDQGRMCMAKMPAGLACKSFAVTIEPMGGMPHPTGPMVLSGSGL